MKRGEQLTDEISRALPARHADLPQLRKAQRGELVSCFLLRIEDNMESIGRAVNSALQLSKRGGGVAFLLSTCVKRERRLSALKTSPPA
jgi:ribonucleoside-diphosphate reductase alpha chain